jgi:signal transduction histidine kinase
MDALAGVIERSRSKRLLEASAKMRSAITQSEQNTDAWLNLAAQTLVEQTYAKYCLVFKKQSDLKFKAVTGAPRVGEEYQLVASANSLISLIAEKHLNVRLSDFRNEDERQAVFQTKEFDAPLVKQFKSFLGEDFRSWMAAPVLIGSHAIAVIMLLNKTKHLAQQFSDTDETILRGVCSDLGRSIPSVETYESMKRISGAKLSPDLSKTENLEKVYDLLTGIIPGVTSAALYLQSPDLLKPELRMLGGNEIWFSNLPEGMKASPRLTPISAPKVVSHAGSDFLFQVKTRSTPQVAETRDEQQFLSATKIPGIEGETGLLLIALHRNYLSDFEKYILSFLGAELGHLLWAERSVLKQLHDVVQVHHAIRSGLSGINHIEVAMSCYEIYKETGNVAELQSARFRKALERTYAFTKKTQVLMDESRFFLSDISRDSLRIGGHSTAGLIRDVARAVNPGAERRHLKIHVDQQLPKEFENVQMDRGLVYMLLFNLLENAVKYSFREKDIHVIASIERDYWILKVKNQGVFIEPADRDVIFKPFFRRPTGQAATTRPGTGLGLAVAQRIAQAHGGSITVESTILEKYPEPLAETCFTVTMPRKLQSKEAK